MPVTGKKMATIARRALLAPLAMVSASIQCLSKETRYWEYRRRFKSASVAEGVSVDPQSAIDHHAAILRDTVVNRSAVGSFSYIGETCLIQNASIGRYCSIANNVTIGPGQHPATHFSTSPVFYRKSNPSQLFVPSGLTGFREYEPVVIRDDVWIGCNAIIQDGVDVGVGAIVGAGAVVTKNVPPYAIVGGVPAKIIKYRFPEDIIKKLIESEWWQQDPENAVELLRNQGIIED